jgi:hypothetical protein
MARQYVHLQQAQPLLLAKQHTDAHGHSKIAGGTRD